MNSLPDKNQEEGKPMAEVSTVESDFSFRKMKTAGICLFGQLFGTNMLLIGPLSMLMLPMTKEFGWSLSQFSFASTAVMWAGALAYPLLGRLMESAFLCLPAQPWIRPAIGSQCSFVFAAYCSTGYIVWRLDVGQSANGKNIHTFCLDGCTERLSSKPFMGG